LSLASGLALASALAVTWALALVPRAEAFTLVISSDLKGWDASILPVHYNPTDCSVSQAQLESAIDSAVALWNSVPMSSIRLRRGRVSTSSASQFTADPIAIYDSPVILCSANFGEESGLDNAQGDGGIDNLVPALVRPAAFEGRLVFAPMLLNSSPAGTANIANFTQEKLTIIIAHEIGHMLGLGHVSDPASLMYFNVSDKELLALSRDDAEGVTYLYPRQEPFAGEFMGCGTLAAVSGRSGGSGAGGGGSGSGGGVGNPYAPGPGVSMPLTGMHERSPAAFAGSALSWLALFVACFMISRLRLSVGEFSEAGLRADPT